MSCDSLQYLNKSLPAAWEYTGPEYSGLLSLLFNQDSSLFTVAAHGQ